jgi:hypothetical protein
MRLESRSPASPLERDLRIRDLSRGTFRNAAFVLSTILLRFSLTEDHPHGAPLASLAMMFEILTLLLFNFHSRICAGD